MLCPDCNHLLQKLSVTTKEGGRFEVDHCGRCGGTWFDPYEINRIPYHEVVSLAQLTVLPLKKTPVTQKQLCPQDHQELSPLTGDAVPRGVKLLTCRKCLGIWATQKDLWEFKKHQQDVMSAYDEGNKFFPNLSMVFVPAVTLLLLLITTFTTISGLQKQKEDRIMAEEIISNLSLSKIAPQALGVTFETSAAVTSEIYLGTSETAVVRIPVSPLPSVSHATIIRGLKSGQTYTYQIVVTDSSGKTYRSQYQTFRF